MLRLRHALRLARELLGFAVLNRIVWFVPVVVLLAALIVAVAVGSTAAPYTLYTLF